VSVVGNTTRGESPQKHFAEVPFSAAPIITRPIDDIRTLGKEVNP